MLLKAEAAINITSELRETFDSVNRAFNDARDLAFNKVVLMTDGNYRDAGYALMAEKNPDQKN